MKHVLSLIVGISWSIFAGAVGMVLVSFASMFGLIPQTALTMTLGFLFGAVPILMLTVWDTIVEPMREATEKARLEREAQVAAVRTKAKAEADALNASYRNAEQNAQLAIQEAESLQGLQASAVQALRNAETFYRDGAFSPFWNAIEEACWFLSEYGRTVQRLSRYATQHSGLTQRCVALGGDARVIKTFPAVPSSSVLERNLAPIVSALGELVYSAQRHPVFSIIWEQRRATATQVAGFRTVEQAVSGVPYALSTALESLDTSITD